MTIPNGILSLNQTASNGTDPFETFVGTYILKRDLCHDVMYNHKDIEDIPPKLIKDLELLTSHSYKKLNQYFYKIDEYGAILINQDGSSRAINVHGYFRDYNTAKQYLKDIKKYFPKQQNQDPSIVSVSFWNASTNGPSESTRKIIAPSWKDIQNNYPSNVRLGIDAIMNFKPSSDVSGSKLILWRGEAGAGKCLGINTPVLMYDGTIKLVQHIIVGDLLMGPDSLPRKVLSLATGKEEMFEIKPVKGDSYIVNKSHILSLYIKDKIYNISVEDWFKKDNTFKKDAKGYRVGIEFNNISKLNELLPPYLLGIWLGDGSSHRTAITNTDDVIIQYFKDFAHDNDLNISESSNPKRCITYFIIAKENKCKKRANKLLNLFKEKNLINNKHIPHEYLCASREDRLELLAGLIDSDGYLTQNCYEIIQKNKQLAEDILFLCRSLGLAAYMKLKFCKAQTGDGDWYYRISISGHIDMIPVKIDYKKASPRQQIKDVLHTGISVISKGIGDYYGFTLDGDGLFLLGDFTVTHNTFCIRALAREWRTWCNVHYVIDPDAFFGSAQYMMSLMNAVPQPNDDKLGFDIADEDWIQDEYESQDGRQKLLWNLLILEDSGDFISVDASQKSSGGQALAKLLNLSDGLLGQGINLMILITTNEEIGNIHKAVSREGRCLSNLSFEAFPEDEAREWLKAKGHEGEDLPEHKILANLYAMLDPTHKQIKNEAKGKRMGFK